MNSRNNKTSDPYRLALNLVDKTNLKRIDRYITLSNLTLNLLCAGNMRNNKFEISASVLNDEFGFPD